MRYLYVLLCFLQTFTTWAQDANSVKEFPFQVLYAENAKNKAGEILKSLDLVSIDDALTVSKGGTLSLIHYTGFPIEVSGDTMVVIQAMQTSNLMAPSRQKVNKSSISRMSIDNLFVSNKSQASKNKLTSAGACHDCNPELIIIYPPKFEKFGWLTNYQKGICIKWVSTNSKSYQVNIKNFDGDSLKSYITDTNELSITQEELYVTDTERLLFVEIVDLDHKKSSIMDILVEFPRGFHQFPYTCDIKKATFALMAGLYIETLPDNYFVKAEAEKYFLLATELSDRPFYKEMLANFKKRTER